MIWVSRYEPVCWFKARRSFHGCRGCLACDRCSLWGDMSSGSREVPDAKDWEQIAAEFDIDGKEPGSTYFTYCNQAVRRMAEEIDLLRTVLAYYADADFMYDGGHLAREALATRDKPSEGNAEKKGHKK